MLTPAMLDRMQTPELAMTQAKWDAMTSAEKNAVRVTSNLHPTLAPLVGSLVEGLYYGEKKRFIVGQSTGWIPVTLGLDSRRASGSSEILTEKNFVLLRVILL